MKKHTKILSLLLTLAMVAVPSSSFEHEEILTTTTTETPVGNNENNKKNKDTMRSPNEQRDQKSKCSSTGDHNSILIPPPHSLIDTSRILTNLEQQEQVEDCIPSKTTTCISIKRGNDGVIADMNISGICSCPDINHAMEAIFCRDTMDRTQLICKVSTKKKQDAGGGEKNETPSCDTNIMLSIDNVDKEDAQWILENEARLEAILMQSSHEFGKDENSGCMDSPAEVVKFHTKYIGFQPS